mmetsp:Transcript_21112/g.60257  ORF Transcript_21112/g.60257 Transcript_21112/m.60257 type:complete len:449 (-) Transcript_21112:1510-2856(-)
MKKLSRYIAVSIWAISALRSCAAINWSRHDFPVTFDGRIYDPENILKESQLKELETKFTEVEADISLPNDAGGADGDTHDIQIAAVIVKKLNAYDFRRRDDPEMAAIEDYARYLHDTWGVGHVTSKGTGTGILIMLATHDRVMYISRGGAVEAYLTDSRIDRIILNLRPFLKGQKYHDALVNAAEMMSHFIKSGTPSWQERFWDILPLFIPVGFIGMIASFLYLAHKKQQQDDREYARAQSELDRLDRAQAEALQGQYRATSCPICLEDFISSTVGSDERPIKLLRCGHVFDQSCWEEWVNSGSGNVTRCPICQQDVGTGSPAPPARNERPQQRQQQGAAAQPLRNRHGIMNDRHDDDNWAIRQFRQERNFRLMRLGQRFPRYVQPQQIQRWTQSNYDGTLSTDRSFVQSNPRTVREAQAKRMNNSSSRSRGSSFGGGGSSGGRGGRW